MKENMQSILDSLRLVYKQAGTGPSRRHIQYSKIENPKNGQSGAPGTARTSPWRAKKGTLPKLSTFLSQLKGEPFGEKTNFRKKVSQCRKTESGTPLGLFNIHSVPKHQKIEGRKFLFLEKKSHSAEKN